MCSECLKDQDQILADMAAVEADLKRKIGENRSISMSNIYRPGWLGMKFVLWMRFATRPIISFINPLFHGMAEANAKINDVHRGMEEQLKNQKMMQIKMDLVIRALDGFNNRLGNVEAELKTLLEVPAGADVVDMTDEGRQVEAFKRKLMVEEDMTEDEAEAEVNTQFVR